MVKHRPRIRSRFRRLVAYLRHNRRRIVVDASLVATWVVLTWTLFSWLELPTWLLYVVLFSGVVVYAQFTPTWERPYRSPD